MIKIALALAAIVGLALLYLKYARPVLERAGMVRALPDGLVDRVKGYLRNSLTIGWGWLLTALGVSVEAAAIISKDEIRETLNAFGQGEWFGFASMVIGVLVIVARMRTAGT